MTTSGRGEHICSQAEAPESLVRADAHESRDLEGLARSWREVLREAPPFSRPLAAHWRPHAATLLWPVHWWWRGFRTSTMRCRRVGIGARITATIAAGGRHSRRQHRTAYRDGGGGPARGAACASLHRELLLRWRRQEAPQRAGAGAPPSRGGTAGPRRARRHRGGGRRELAPACCRLRRGRGCARGGEELEGGHWPGADLSSAGSSNSCCCRCACGDPQEVLSRRCCRWGRRSRSNGPLPHLPPAQEPRPHGGGLPAEAGILLLQPAVLLADLARLLADLLTVRPQGRL